MHKTFEKLNLPVLFFALCLNALGLIFIASATQEGFSGAYVKKQLLWIALGLCACAMSTRISLFTWARWAYPIYGLGCALLLFVLAFGTTVKGGQRWINLGPFNVQPSEIMKFAYILALARYLRYRKNYRSLLALAGPFALTMVPVALIVKQPDLGSSIVFLPILFFTLYAVGAQPRHLIGIILLGAIATVPLWHFGLHDYQKNRIRAFMEPEKHRATYAYQVIQSQIAVGSGRLLGKGWQKGMQHKFRYLPEPHTDFIFAVIAEEWGFAGASAVILLEMLLCIACLACFFSVQDPFSRILIVGVTVRIFVQAAINVSVVTGLLPTTGITLPLVSYGGSSMLSVWAELGLLMNAAGAKKPDFSDEE